MDRHLSQDLTRFVGRDRNGMEKWVSVAASWTRVAELIHPHVADAAQAGWEFLGTTGHRASGLLISRTLLTCCAGSSKKTLLT